MVSILGELVFWRRSLVLGFRFSLVLTLFFLPVSICYEIDFVCSNFSHFELKLKKNENQISKGNGPSRFKSKIGNCKNELKYGLKKKLGAVSVDYN